MLFQVDADAAEESLLAADIRLIGQRRRIKRQQRDIVPLVDQFSGERVVAQTTAAIHSGGAGGDVENIHMLRAPPLTIIIAWAVAAAHLKYKACKRSLWSSL